MVWGLDNAKDKTKAKHAVCISLPPWKTLKLMLEDGNKQCQQCI